MSIDCLLNKEKMKYFFRCLKSIHNDIFTIHCFQSKINAETSDLHPSVMCTSKTESIYICCEKKIFFEKIPVSPLRDDLVNNDNFFNNSAIS